MNKLKNKVAVITGANSGIGLATAKLFIENGAKVVLSGRRQEALDEATKDLQGDFITVLADVTKPQDNINLIKKSIEKYGAIDVLYLNAGVSIATPTNEVTEAHIDMLFNTNVKGPILTVKEALPHINDGGSILFTNSVVHHRGFDGLSTYSASKGALRAYSRVLASEVRSRGIRVNSIAPGPIDTSIWGKMGMSNDDIDGIASQIPLGRFGNAEEIAHTALFLASDDATFINGVELKVDGGMSQM